MQIKHLIIFAVVGMVVLLGFNIMSGNQREKNREAIIASSQAELADSAVSKNNGPNTSNANGSDTSDIASQPLGQQPKAILDKATTQIAQAEQTSQQPYSMMLPAK